MTAEGEPCEDAKVAYVVVCIDHRGDETTHIFSSDERRNAFMALDAERSHVAYEYLMDAPQAHEGQRQ